MILDEEYQQSTSEYQNAKIINASFGLQRSSGILDQESIEGIIRVAKDHVVVKSFGNTHGKPQEYLSTLTEIYQRSEFLEHAILVVNLTRDNLVHPTSNRPRDAWEYPAQILGQQWTNDEKQRVMDNTISALGSDVAGLDGPYMGPPRKFDVVSGTSVAVPTVTGALALVDGMGKQAGVELQAWELKWILLNSARKDTFIPGKDGRSGTFIVSPEQASRTLQELANRDSAVNSMTDAGKAQRILAALEKQFKESMSNKRPRIVFQHFDPGTYGVGFLDIRRLILLAERYIALRKETPQLFQGASLDQTLSTLRQNMAFADNESQIQAVQKIEDAFRKKRRLERSNTKFNKY